MLGLRRRSTRAEATAARPAERSVSGRARLGRRTKRLTPRLRPGDIAVLDHSGIDRVSAEALVASGVRCVVNAQRSESRRYPNQGPLILVQAGIHLVDFPGAGLFDLLHDGDEVTVAGPELWLGDRLLARGEVRERADIERELAERREEIGAALEAFAENTIAHIREEKELLSGRIDLPAFRTDFRDRPALVVVRGTDHKRDLRILRAFLRDTRPALVAVDGGADALLEEGLRPDMIVGDMDSASDRALRCGAELVVHAYPDGRAPGRERLLELGLEHEIVPAPATSEDVAMLIAAEKGARLIVSVGSHFNLVEFLDKNREGMSSTFLTRLRIGEILVDAKGVSRLYRPSAGRGPIALISAAAFVTFVIAVATSEKLGPLLDLIWLKLQVLLGLE